MKQVTCERCEEGFQINDTLKVRGDVVCGPCAESMVTKEKIPVDQVQQQIDPTICAGCGLDNGDAEFVRLGPLPVCSSCEALFRNRPFPIWIKAALVGMIILVVSTFVWNSRFISAYYELKCFESVMSAGDIQRGAAYFASLSRRIPENKDLQAYRAFYEGILLLNQDKSAEALELLESCRGRIDEESGLDILIRNAKVGVAFDRGDYDEFLRLAQELSGLNQDDPIYAGQLASAYACKYAETQDEQYKVKSLIALEQARMMTSMNPEYEAYHDEYAQRILHRLHTREIIDRDEFHKRYPNGWTKEGEEAQ